MNVSPGLRRKLDEDVTLMAKKQGSDSARPSAHRNKLVGLRLEADIREQAQNMATTERRSLALMCAILVEEALAARQQQQGK
jgi:hypothetical protein